MTEHADGADLDDERRALVDLLVRLLLDDLAPAVEAYRRAVARRLDLEPVDLLCLDVVRRLDETPSSALTAWTGLTRSALSKSLRRLEDAAATTLFRLSRAAPETDARRVRRRERDRREVRRRRAVDRGR